MEQFVAFQALHNVGATKHLEERIIDQCCDIDDKLDAWGRQHSPEILRFDFRSADSPIAAPQNDAELSLLHLSMMSWIVRMILYSILRFFIERHGIANLNARTATHCELAPKCDDPAKHCLDGLDERRSCCADLYASKCVHALHLFGAYRGSAAEGMSIMVPLWFTMRYYLNKASRQYVGDEEDLLRHVLNAKLYGSPAWTHLTKISGQKSDIDSVMKGEKPTIDTVLWF